MTIFQHHMHYLRYILDVLGLKTKTMDSNSNSDKIVRIIWPKIPQMLQNLSDQAQKFWILLKKGFIGHP